MKKELAKDKQEPIYFITGNKNKFAEVKAMLPGVEKLELDLPEIQETDAHKIIQAKIKEAFKHIKGRFMVEDTSLYIESLNGLPGPLIKWFLEKLGNEGIYKITEGMGKSKEIYDAVKTSGNYNAQARTIIGYAKNKDEILFFEGVIEGEIVKPSGETSFGWDPIFKPVGQNKTFQQMTKEEKNAISMRKMAVEKLKKYLNSSQSS